MSFNIIDGKAIANKLLEKEKQHVQEIVGIRNRAPRLVVITVGDNDASKVYVRNKQRACEQCGIDFLHETFGEDTTRISMIEHIEHLNEDTDVDGILIQQPVPAHLKGVEQWVANNKDVDGFTTFNIGATLNPTHDSVTACTPMGVIELLHEIGMELEGKNVAVIGRSNIVGKPLIGLLLKENCTVFSCNSYTENLSDITKMADIIITAVGKPKLINSSYLRHRCTCIIDVGINRDENGKLCGDCDLESIKAYWELNDIHTNRYITPVPGGVGPMTVWALIHNVVGAYLQNYRFEIENKLGGTENENN